MHRTKRTRKCGLPFAVVALLAVVLLGISSGCSGLNSQSKNAEGVALFQQGRYNEAVYPFQQAISLSPQHPDGYYNLASTYHRMGALTKDQRHYDEAEKLYNQCLDWDPNHVACHRGYAVLLAETGRRDLAARLLQRWAERTPHLAAPKIEIARMQAELGDNEKAKQLLYEALAVEHSNPRALAALGSLHEQTGEYHQALADYQRAFEQNRFQDGVADRIASLQAKTGPVPLPQDPPTHLQIDVPQTAQTPGRPLR